MTSFFDPQSHEVGSDGPRFAPVGVASATIGDERLPQRFWKKVAINQVTGCWEWTAATRKGYGQFQYTRNISIAHRVSYEVLVGKIPGDLQLDHLCRVRHCVNPAHLEPVTQQENLRRGSQKKWNTDVTHCIRGHKFTPENTYTYARGNRDCVKCKALRSVTRSLALLQKKLDKLRSKRDGLISKQQYLLSGDGSDAPA